MNPLLPAGAEIESVPLPEVEIVVPLAMLRLAEFAAGLALPVIPRKTGEESREKGITPALPVTVPPNDRVEPEFRRRKEPLE